MLDRPGCWYCEPEPLCEQCIKAEEAQEAGRRAYEIEREITELIKLEEESQLDWLDELTQLSQEMGMYEEY